MSNYTERPCERCSEPTLNERFCRSCDLEWVSATNMCRECKHTPMNPDFFGPISAQHAPSCSLKDTRSYTAPTEAEAWAMYDAWLERGGDRARPAQEG